MKLKIEPMVMAASACVCACVSPPAPATPPQATSPASSPLPGTGPGAAPIAPAAKPRQLSAVALPLPDATAPVALDFLFYESEPTRVWVPAGGSGAVDVFDVAKHTFQKVGGFQTLERVANGRKRVLGPSAGALADGFAYIGNRATREICAMDRKTLEKGSCSQLPDPIDCVASIPLTHQIWVTAPSKHSLIVLDAQPTGKLEQKATIELEGEPEGYAVDETRKLFLTNLEDKGTTLAIDIATRQVSATWNAGCPEDGPRGVAVDPARALLFVACTDHVQAIDMAHGAPLGRLDTGAGLDNIDYVPGTGLLYAAAGKAARLTVAHVDGKGQFEVLATADTRPGARNAVADRDGNVYVADPQGANLLLFAIKDHSQ